MCHNDESECGFGIMLCELASAETWGDAVRSPGLQGSKRRQNKLHCCSIPPPTRSPCSLTRTHSLHEDVRVQYTCACDQRVSACVFPARCLHHSFFSLSYFSPLFCSFSQSLPPCFDPFPLFSPTHSQSQKHAHAPIYPPTHAVGTAESLTKTVRFGVGLCKETQKLVRHHCLMVSPWQLKEQGPAMRCQTNTGF